MKTLYVIAASVTLAVGTAVIAHPTDVYFASRGECEAAYAQQNQTDRAMLVEFGIAQTTGEAMRDIHNRFDCEYDDEVGAWHFVDRFAAEQAQPSDSD
jgi:hypothetical protein